MQFIECAAFGSRVAGKLTNRLALGTTLQTSIFTSSRIFLPPLLLTLSFMIESNLNIQLFLWIGFSFTISAFLGSLIVLVNFNYFQLLFQRIFFHYNFNSIPVAILKSFLGKKSEIDLVQLETIPQIKNLRLTKILTSTVAYTFLSTGFLIAFALAILVPEYRMTVSNLSSVFHGVGALLLALYIDPMISRSLDIELENSHWLENVYVIFIGRVTAYLVASTVFLFNIYFLDYMIA